MKGLGQILLPNFDVAEMSQKHVRKIFINQFNPIGIAKEGMRNAPGLVDSIIRSPMIISEGLRLFEKMVKNPSPNPLMGIKGTMFAGFCLVAGAIVASMNGPWPVWAAMFGLAAVVAIKN